MKKLQNAGLILLGFAAGLALSGPAVQAAEAWVRAERSPQTVYIDGVQTELESYLIGDANYVKLRDIAEKTDAFNVYWDGAVRIETGTAYTGEASPAVGTRRWKTAYANYSGDSGIYFACLNRVYMPISSVQHLPIYKFDSLEELEQFRESFGDKLTMDRGYDEVPSFDAAVEEYDAAYFEDHTLLLVYVVASSGSYRYGLKDFSLENSSCCIHVEPTVEPEVGTTDMSGWFLLVEAEDAELQGVTDFDAQMH